LTFLSIPKPCHPKRSREPALSLPKGTCFFLKATIRPVLKGHGFSRAAQTHRRRGASAPEVRGALNRKDLNDGQRFALAVTQIAEKRLTYSELTGKTNRRATKRQGRGKHKPSPCRRVSISAKKKASVSSPSPVQLRFWER